MSLGIVYIILEIALKEKESIYISIIKDKCTKIFIHKLLYQSGNLDKKLIDSVKIQHKT